MAMLAATNHGFHCAQRIGGERERERDEAGNGVKNDAGFADGCSGEKDSGRKEESWMDDEAYIPVHLLCQDNTALT